METKRINEMYRPCEQRVSDFLEVERSLTSAEIKTQGERCMDCGIPFCHGNGCPLHNVIPEINSAAAKGNWHEAYMILSRTSNFPEFTSRVCPALCEGSCVCGINNEAVMVRQLEKCVIEKAFSSNWVNAQPLAPAQNKKVAVIGSGPSGLAVADELSKRGFEVTVFEKHAAPGGLLRYGIPNFKLEKHIIDRRIEILKQNGVIFEFDTQVGDDVSGEWLQKRFDAVVLAIGTQMARDLEIPGRELKNIHLALEYLGSMNKFVTHETSVMPFNVQDKKILVIGGGDTGSDCVGTSNRLGARSVEQIEIMPMPPKDRSNSTPWPDWPYLLRTSSSHKEGCKREWNVLTKEFVGENGVLRGVKTVKVEWEFSADGKPLKFKEVPDSELFIEADYAFLALGFTGVKVPGVVSELKLQIGPRGVLLPREEDGIFVCGDAACGQSLIVRAIAHGKLTADAVEKYLK